MQIVSEPRRLQSLDDDPVPEPTKLVRDAFDRLKAGYRAEPSPSFEVRIDRLNRLRTILKRQQNAMITAIRNDFGTRSPHETKMGEILAVLSQIKYIEDHLKGWMKSEPRKVSLNFMPASAKVMHQPLGVIGIISPWNYPFQLALGPLAIALAAGNRALIKPSEYTPATSELIQRMVREIYDNSVAEVVTGAADVGEAFTRLPFDHLLFTGSTALGRVVMKAAAANLTPVTLELGGKSPAIVHPSFSLEKAAERIAYGKTFNAGQTCVAPDYVLVHESQAEALAQGIAQQIATFYPTLDNNADYTSIVSDRHYQRLEQLVQDAERRGAKKISVDPEGNERNPRERKFPPTILLGVNDDMLVMQDEIFGPVLPIVTFKELDEAIGYVNDRPRPLSLYYFDTDTDRQKHVLRNTVSGGAAINECLLHQIQEDLPFGGVGPSGMGAYHGREGFDTFSHKKAVFQQARFNAAKLLLPPYGERINKLLKMLLG